MAWQRYQELIIDSSLVSGSTNLTDFPLLITEDNLDADVFSRSLSGGADIRFTTTSVSAEQDEMAREIVAWGSGATEIWVKIPELVGTADTTFYCWYGNSDATEPDSGSTSGSSSVWNDSYLAVWHFSEDPNVGPCLDSTIYANNAYLSGTGNVGSSTDYATTGYGHSSINFSGDNSYLDFGTGLFDYGHPWNITAVVGRQIALTSPILWTADSDGNFYQGCALLIAGNNYPEMFMGDGEGVGAEDRRSFTRNVVIGSDGDPLHIYGGCNTLTTGQVWMSGSNDTQGNSGSGGEPVWNVGTPRGHIGARLQSTDTYYSGHMYELRFSTGSTDGEWAVTEYNNMSDPGAFTSGAALTIFDITSWAELAAMSGDLSESYYLQNDLGSGDTGYAGIGDDWMPIGAGSGSDTAFSGDFYGSGYTISDVIVQDYAAQNVGFFGYVAGGGYIRDLHLSNFTLIGDRTYVGGIAGITNASTISGCSTSGIVSGYGHVGGIAGRAYSTPVEDCHSSMDVIGRVAFAGGICGSWGYIRKCYFDGNVDCIEGTGGVVGTIEWGHVYDSYSVGGVTGTTNAGAAAGVAGASGIRIYTSGWLNHAGNPDWALGSETGTSITYEETVASEFYDATHGVYTDGTYVWDFTTPVWYEWVNTYPQFTVQPVITAITHWAELAAMSAYTTETYVLQNDLGSGTSRYAGIGDDWVPVGDSYSNRFQGRLSGEGYTISDLVITGKSENQVGLFGYTEDAVIADLTLSNLYVYANSDYVSGIAGYIDGTDIFRCAIQGGITGVNRVGGIAGGGYGGAIIQDCYCDAVVRGGGFNVGGIVGSRAYIRSCYFVGDISAWSIVGGLVGDNGYGSISDSYSVGSVTASTIDVGALVGASGTGINIVNSGWYNFTGNPDWAIGNLTGETVTYDESDNTVFYDASHGVYTAGTYVWDFATPVWYEHPATFPTLSTFTYEIRNWTDLDAIPNDSTSTWWLMENLSSGTTDYVGIGDDFTPVYIFRGDFSGMNRTISDLIIDYASDYCGLFTSLLVGATCSDLGLINPIVSNNEDHTGGIAGYGSGDAVIRHCYVSGGTITGLLRTGGIAGDGNVLDIINCYSTCNVVGIDYVGGITGRRGDIDNCYATGSISGSGSYVGGVCGEANGIIRNCYATGFVTAGTSNDGGVIGFDTGATISGCGWFKQSSGVPDYAIGNTSGNVDWMVEVGGSGDYIDDDESWFYDKTRGIYTDNSPVWDFATPVWYEWIADYPQFTKDPSTGETPTLTIMYNPAIIGASF